MVVAIELPSREIDEAGLHARVREALAASLSGRVGTPFQQEQSRPEPIVFHAPDLPPLAFLFYDLAEPRPDAPSFTKKVIHETHADNLAAFDALRSDGMQPLSAMPHWLGSSQQAFGDGSPATLPRPARPDKPDKAGRLRYRYTPAGRNALKLNFRGRSSPERVPSVPVVILDTRPDWRQAQRLAGRLSGSNAQLPELLDFLGDTSLPEWHTAAIDLLDEQGIKLTPTPDGRARHHVVSDHALFIAGLVHDLAPSSPIQVRPVLSKYGVGDLHVLLRVLQSVLANKPEGEPVVLNMSLGFVPKLEHLAWMWYDVQPRGDAEFIRDVPIQDESRDLEWMARNRAEVKRTTDLLHNGLERLGLYLAHNNCLGVAAAGNDSLGRVDTGHPRFGPRIPARYKTFLGVAATTADPRMAAGYSNVGDELQLGDHVATLGGSVDPKTDRPVDGVVGVYASARFPRGPAHGGPVDDLENATGWAEWSGTSFATGIVSGLVAGYWATAPTDSAGDVLAKFHELASEYAPGVRTPSIPISGEWQTA